MKTDPMKRLKNHADELDMPEGHMERFASRLDDRFRPATRLRIWQRVALAASIIFIAGMSVLLYNSINDLDPASTNKSGERSELLEAELYLQSEMDTKIAKLLSCQMVDENLIADLTFPDRTLIQIKEDLRQNPGDQRLVDAVIEAYQTKLEILDRVIEQCETYDNL